jgi:sucrose-6-phosphate hydrolase SacC (GH32 family)
MLWPGDLNDANGILEHRGVFHAMFQTPVWKNGVNGTGQPPACHGAAADADDLDHAKFTEQMQQQQQTQRAGNLPRQARDKERAGNLTLFTTRTEAMNCTSAFTVAAGEKSVLLRVVVDRSVIEAFAAGGRGC